MLSFRYIGHACVQISYQNHSVLIDPWFGHPFHGGNMIAYPPIATPPPAVLNAVSLVHISHIHQDHFCPKSLEHLAKDLPVIIGEYEGARFAEAILQSGFKNIIRCPLQGATFGPFHFFVIPFAPFDGSYDSLVIIECDGKKVLLNNDCLLNETAYRDLYSKFGEIDYGFLGYCNVSPYPSCYRISGVDAESLIAQSQRAAWDHVTLMDSVFKFKRIIPYANGIRLIDPSTRRFNRAFNRLDQAHDHLPADVAAKIHLCEPGAEWDENFSPASLKFQYESSKISDFFDANGVSHSHTFADGPPLTADGYRKFFEGHFSRIQRKFDIPIDIGCRILDRRGDCIHAFRFYSDKIQVIDPNQPDPAPITVEFPALWIDEVVRGRMSIASIYYAFQFRATYKQPIKNQQGRVHLWF